MAEPRRLSGGAVTVGIRCVRIMKTAQASAPPPAVGLAPTANRGSRMGERESSASALAAAGWRDGEILEVRDERGRGGESDWPSGAQARLSVARPSRVRERVRDDVRTAGGGRQRRMLVARGEGKCCWKSSVGARARKGERQRGREKPGFRQPTKGARGDGQPGITRVGGESW